jgi:hypothetical protein
VYVQEAAEVSKFCTLNAVENGPPGAGESAVTTVVSSKLKMTARTKESFFIVCLLNGSDGWCKGMRIYA